MSDADLYFVPIIFILIPLIILHIGAILSYFKANFRKSIGFVLIVVGAIEMSYWLIVIRVIIWWFPIYLLTLVLGVVSIYYSVRAIKN